MKKRVALAAVAALALSGSASAATFEASDLEAKLGTPTRIYCEDPWPYPTWDGFADLPRYAIYVHPDACATLRGRAEVNARYANALLTLLHELGHVGWQNRNESATECFALFVFRWEARHAFGMSRSDAQSLYVFAWRVHEMLPPNYLGCEFLRRDPLSA